MSYNERLRRYEQEKRRLQSMNLTCREYEKSPPRAREEMEYIAPIN